ncbi:MULTISPECIES: hypothetical protein [unclassified Nonomuraea]|uniref:hypothetical protein n=1 Tax=unclassified Nonomuraea TaxID=2593643 RepID=UPI0033EF9A2D
MPYWAVKQAVISVPGSRRRLVSANAPHHVATMAVASVGTSTAAPAVSVCRPADSSTQTIAKTPARTARRAGRVTGVSAPAV